MEAIELKGKVYKLGSTEERGEKKFKVRELILEIEGQYPQYIKLEGNGDKCALMDDLVPGTIATFNVNVNGRLWKDSAFNSLQIWKFNVNQSVANNAPAETPPF